MARSEDKSTEGSSENTELEQRTSLVGTKKALIGGVIAGVIALSAQWLVGQIYSGLEARRLLEGMISSALFFGSSIVTGPSSDEK